MSKGLVLGLGAAGVFGLAVFASRDRRVRSAASSAAKTVTEAAKKGIAQVATTAIPNDVLKNFVAHDLSRIIEETRTDPKTGKSIPWALAASIIELESGGDPGIYNYYPNGVGKPPKKIGYWRPGDPLPDGQDGRPHAWAAGVAQIIRKYDRGLTLVERFDARKSLEKMMPEWRTFAARAAAAGLSGPALWSAVYFGHNKGAGSQLKGLGAAAQGFEAVVKASGLEAAAQGPALAVALRVATRVALWTAAESAVKTVGSEAQAGAPQGGTPA